jgi:hypothetical protein
LSAVVVEVPEVVGQASGLLDEQVDRLGAAVGDAAGVEVGEHLLSPLTQRAAKPGDLGDRAGRERGDDLLGDLTAAAALGGVGRAELLVGRPGDGDLVVRVAGLQTAVEFGELPVGEVFVAVAQQSADLVERVVSITAPVQGVLLDAAPHLVDDLGAEVHDMEGVKHRDSIREFVTDGVGVATERVECGVLDRVEELGCLLPEPAGVDRPGPAGNDVESAARAGARRRRGSDRPCR